MAKINRVSQSVKMGVSPPPEKIEKGKKVFDVKKKVKTKRFILKKFKLSASIGGYAKGATISLKCDKKTGIPKDSYWRRRLREAEIDNCMVVVKEVKKEVIKEKEDTKTQENNGNTETEGNS